MKKFATKAMIAVMLVVIVCFGLLLGLRYVLGGRWTGVTQADFVSVADKNQYLVQGVYDFKAEHGVWPQSLEGLFPKYVSTPPRNPFTMLESGILSIHVDGDFDDRFLCYSFRPENEGWLIKGDSGETRCFRCRGLQRRGQLSPARR